MTDKNQNSAKKSAMVVKDEFEYLSKINNRYSKDQREFIKDVLAPTLDMKQVRLFLYRSEKMGLNPLEGEAHAYRTYTKIQGQKVPKMVMIVSRDAKRRKAFESGKLQSIKTKPIYVAKRKLYAYEIELEDEQKKPKVKQLKDEAPAELVEVEPWEGGKLWGARCVIKRADFDEPFEVTVPLKEYQRDTTIWKYKPETMIKKVAESQCLSYAFPELVGVYDSAEMPESEVEEATEPESGSKPATDNQKETIKKMGGKVDEDLTYQEAKQTMMKLAKGEK